jgi:hypothetical protein
VIKLIFKLRIKLKSSSNRRKKFKKHRIKNKILPLFFSQKAPKFLIKKSVAEYLEFRPGIPSSRNPRK